MYHRCSHRFIAIVTLITTLACGGGTSSPAETTPTDQTEPTEPVPTTPVNESSLTLSLTDAPITGATAVVIQFTGVELKPVNGEPITFQFSDNESSSAAGEDLCPTLVDGNVVKCLDLLTLQGDSATTLLDAVTLPAGEYSYIRLLINAEQATMDSIISFDDGSDFSLFLPNDNQSGLTIDQDFTLATDQTADFTIDFDLAKSILNSTELDDYLLKPQLRLVNNNEIGHIHGVVDEALLANEPCHTEDAEISVYIWRGNNIIPVDIGGFNSDPLTTALVSFSSESSLYQFEVGFVEAGSYALALTCEAELDNPETIESLSFEITLEVNVTENTITPVEITASPDS